MSCRHGKLDGCAVCEEIALLRCYASHLRSALVVARRSLEQGQTINGRVAANGPTIGQVIDGALALEPQP